MPNDISTLSDIYYALTTGRSVAQDALSMSYRGRADETDRAQSDLAVINRGLEAYSRLSR